MADYGIEALTDLNNGLRTMPQSELQALVDGIDAGYWKLHTHEKKQDLGVAKSERAREIFAYYDSDDDYDEN